MNTTPTTQDRVWAVVSHLSSLAFGMGIVLPIVGWSDQRRKSNYAAFQSLQALGYQSLGFTIWVLSYLVILLAILILALAIPEAGSREGTPGVIPALWQILFSVVALGFFAVYFLLPIIAAIACAFGKDFRYPIMGNRLACYLAYDPTQKSDEQVWLTQEHEFRWVAAAGHFSILILIWGMLAALTTWILYGKRSLFLRFQSIQTLLYQGIVTVLYFAGTALYGIGLLALVFSIVGTGKTDGNSLVVFGLVVAVVFLLLGGVIILLIPLLHILGQWAGYRVLKGDNYHYPLIGRRVDQWIAKESLSKEKPA